MPNLKLKAETRSELGSTRARHLRADGKVPAVLYGKGEKPTSLSVDGQAMEAVLKGKARMIDLEVGGKTQTIFLKEVQRDAIEEHLIHVDFLQVRMDQILRVTVPLHYKGVPAGAAEGGVVNQIAHTIEIECLPGDLPEAIDCPIAQLKLDESIHLKDLVLPARVKAVGDLEAMLVNVQKPLEEVPAEAGAEGAKEPELIRKEKAEGDEDEEKKDEKGAAKPADDKAKKDGKDAKK